MSWVYYKFLLKYFTRNYSFLYIKLSLWPCIILILNIVAFATAPNHELSSSDRSLSITYVYTYVNYKIDSLATATSSASLESKFLSLCNSTLQWATYYHHKSKLLFFASFFKNSSIKVYFEGQFLRRLLFIFDWSNV